MPARTAPRTFGPDSVNCVNVTDADACAGTDARFDSISWPSTSSVTLTSCSAASPLLLRPALTVTRSWPENAARPKLTDGTARFAVSLLPTETVLSVMPSGKRASSDPLQPDF